MTLAKLIDAVEAGSRDNDFWSAVHVLPAIHITDITLARDGSLDAAKRLHDALLPGWVWGRTEGNIFVQNPAKNRWNTFWGGPNKVDARSFLLAILRALEQEGRDG